VIPTDANMQVPLYKRPKDLVWYLGISAALITVVVVVSVTGVNWNTFSKWLYIVVSILFVFWYLITGSRTLWRYRSFWIFTFTLLILHGVALTIVFENVEKVKPVLFFPGVWLELFVFVLSRNLLFPGHSTAFQTNSSDKNLNNNDF
jgi:hypothetical protein